jgi:predicted NAD-dependent protein-ADP-ribosyltransferase YbiA (DUF1768 family)
VDPVTKGERASNILDSEVYIEAVEGARGQIKHEWTQAKGQIEREALWHKYQAIDAVTTALRILRDRGIQERKKQEK